MNQEAQGTPTTDCSSYASNYESNYNACVQFAEINNENPSNQDCGALGSFGGETTPEGTNASTPTDSTTVPVVPIPEPIDSVLNVAEPVPASYDNFYETICGPYQAGETVAMAAYSLSVALKDGSVTVVPPGNVSAVVAAALNDCNGNPANGT
jgi:hypothetical protein